MSVRGLDSKPFTEDLVREPTGGCGQQDVVSEVYGCVEGVEACRLYFMCLVMLPEMHTVYGRNRKVGVGCGPVPEDGYAVRQPSVPVDGMVGILM